jgi:hypothetical protein
MTSKSSDKLPIRHGDVVLHPIDKRPIKGLKKIPGSTLARGTATGHSHKLSPVTAATLYELPVGEKGCLLVVKTECRLTHQEHKTITLEPGFYRVMIKRQFDAVLGQRVVVD